VERKGFYIFLGIFEKHHTLSICLGVFALGVALGFFVYGIYQQKLEVLVPAAIILSILTWFGSATDIIGLMREWYKDKKEEERREQEQLAKLPILSIEYDERNKDQYCPILLDDRIESYGWVSRKLLRIRVLNSGGEANDCEAVLKVIKKPDFPNPTTEEKYLQWAKNNDTKINLPHNKDAFLNIVFSMIPKDKSYVAFASRPKNLDSSKPPSSVDGFMVGDYDLSVKIMPENGDHLSLQFLLHVKSEWNELSMERIK